MKLGPKQAALSVVVVLAAVIGGWWLWQSRARPKLTQTTMDAGAVAPAPAPPRLPVPHHGPGDTNLEGTVRDGSGQPVTGVAISATRETIDGRSADGGPDVVVVANAGGDGSFKLQGLERGRYRLVVEGPDIADAEIRFVAVPGPAVDVLVTRSVAIHGRVVRNGKAVAAADVVVVLDDIVKRTKTDELGIFRFDGLVQATYSVAAYIGNEATPTVGADRTGTGPFPPLELTMEASLSIRGMVVDDLGAGVPAQVRLSSESGQIARIAEAGTDGRFVVAGVLPGPWSAQASAIGFVSVEAVRFRAESGYQPHLRLSRGGVLHGVVVDHAGKPVPGATIAVIGRDADGRERSYGGELGVVHSGGRALASHDPRFLPVGELGVLLGPIPKPPPVGARRIRVATPVVRDAAPSGSRQLVVSDSEGQFEIAGLATGRYQAVARHVDYADARSSQVAVTFGKTTNVRVVASPGLIIVGIVAAAGQGGVVGATVRATDSAGLILGQAVTDDTGRYQLGPVAGRVSIVASAHGYGTASASLTVRGQPADRERTVDLRLTRADARLAGRILDRTGFAVPNAALEVVGKSYALATDLSDEHGRFEMTGLVGGRVRLRVTHADYPEHLFTLKTGDDRRVEIDWGGGLEVIVIDRHRGTPVPGTQVEVKTKGGKPIVLTTTASGRVEFLAMAVDEYKLTINHSDYVAATRMLKIPRSSAKGRVSVRGERIEIERGALVVGTVRDQNGERVPGARVVAGAVRASSDTDGRFRLERVRPGKVVVVASSSGSSGELRLTLDPGDEVTTAEVTVSP